MDVKVMLHVKTAAIVLAVIVSGAILWFLLDNFTVPTVILIFVSMLYLFINTSINLEFMDKPLNCVISYKPEERSRFDYYIFNYSTNGVKILNEIKTEGSILKTKVHFPSGLYYKMFMEDFR